MKFSRPLLFIILSTILFLLAGSKVFGQSYADRQGDSINPRFYVKAGFYYPNLSTTLRIDGRRLGTEIGLEDDLGLSEDLAVFRADAFVRLAKNSELVVTYTKINRERSLTLKEDIEFQDIIFEQGSGVNFNFDVDYFAATYRHSFFNNLNWKAGVSGGLRGVFINTGFEAQLNNAFTSSKTDFMAPAILFGFHGSAYLTPRLLARYAIEFFWLEIEGVKINILESNASVTWFFSKSVGIGLAHSTNNYRVEEIPFGSDLKGRVRFNFGGINAFLAARF